MAISLEKRAETVGIILAKRGITSIPKIRVGAALDISGSAQSLYYNGVMQETFERLLAVALKFDDNGELDMWAFSNSYKQLETATAANVKTFLQEHLLNARGVPLWGGTEYGGVLESAVSHYFKPSVSGMFGSLFGGGKKSFSSEPPAMVLFITDGANSDRNAAAKVLKEAQGKPVYFMMVGVGPAYNFNFIKEQADALPNVGFVNLNSLSMTDEQLYEQLVSGEFATWVKQYVK